MARRSSPGQPKISRRPTASDRARRQRTRRMEASQLDQAPMIREKTTDQPSHISESPCAGHSGGDVNEIGVNTTAKLSVSQYNTKVALGTFKVSDQPQFLNLILLMEKMDSIVNHKLIKGKIMLPILLKT